MKSITNVFRPYRKDVKIEVRKLKEAAKLIYEGMGYNNSKKIGISYFYNQIMYEILKEDSKLVLCEGYYDN